jgi:hypothetical protein
MALAVLRFNDQLDVVRIVPGDSSSSVVTGFAGKKVVSFSLLDHQAGTNIDQGFVRKLDGNHFFLSWLCNERNGETHSPLRLISCECATCRRRAPAMAGALLLLISGPRP